MRAAPRVSKHLTDFLLSNIHASVREQWPTVWLLHARKTDHLRRPISSLGHRFSSVQIPGLIAVTGRLYLKIRPSNAQRRITGGAKQSTEKVNSKEYQCEKSTFFKSRMTLVQRCQSRIGKS